MNELVSQSGAENIFKIFVLGTFMILFWLLESAWTNNKRWLIPIFIFPPTIFLFVVNYWSETRAKCFFAALLFIIMLLISGVIGHGLFERIMHMLKLIAFWPYYLGAYLTVRLPS